MARTLEQRLDELRRGGVDTVRINYGDMHGIARGKDLPVEHFADAVEEWRAVGSRLGRHNRHPESITAGEPAARQAPDEFGRMAELPSTQERATGCLARFEAL